MAAQRGKVFIGKSHLANAEDFPPLVIGKVLAICFSSRDSTTVYVDHQPDMERAGTWYYLEGKGMPIHREGELTLEVAEPAGLMKALRRRRGKCS